ncbi:MAG TPA: glycoside hydrolase family 2 TIM barrel-domain containing protein [Chthoniobacteraceae bacterium]|jgi:hypothetical protein|nr:glycoside hydrolase family 2 TIM barrel-domain containing protein [Chthoniobacteraceae bacterium]
MFIPLKFHGSLVAAAWLLLAGSAPAADWKIAPSPLTTQWAADVSPDNALPEYPRPQMTRSAWQNLNGLWDYALTDVGAAAPPASFTGKILVPYPYESALSGVGQGSPYTQRLWYRRTFTVPDAWKSGRVLLHFGAVNWDCSVLVNGKPVGGHRGGYTAFECDITDALHPGDNELVVSVINPLTVNQPGAQVMGKQRIVSKGIFYTASTGIWQTVWLEPVPANHIDSLKMVPDIDSGVLHLTVRTDAPAEVTAVAEDGSAAVGKTTGKSGGTLDLRIPNPRLWSPDDPHLYGLTVTLIQDGRAADSVGSYFAMRKISLGKGDRGRTRILLNNKFLLQIGLLDQGYWPDGLYTAPTDAALKFDIQTAKDLGYNLLRKHAKVEPQRWYYWADHIGMLVWQDMPQAFGAAPKGTTLNDEAKQEWLKEWQAEIAEFSNAPSIIVWTPFNEGWGQHDTEQIVALTRKLDPNRLIDDASGWTDKNVGDIIDTHAYPGPWSHPPEENRAAVNGEFGGVTEMITGHTWVTGKTFGYGAVIHDNPWLATKHYAELLKKAYDLSDDRGTSAFVYTELTDVEQEMNGILTYDRKVVKMDKDLLIAANHGKFPAFPPNPHPPVVATSEDEPVEWRYTTVQPPAGWQSADFNDSGWKTGLAVIGHAVPGVRTEWTTDDIWIRRHVTLPAQLPAKLEFNVFHDEDVEIYLNGVLSASAPKFSRGYVLLPVSPEGRATLKPGDNVIAAHVHQTVGGQGIDIGMVDGATQ